MLFEPFCPVDTVLLYCFYCTVSVLINKIFIHSFRVGVRVNRISRLVGVSRL